MSTTATICLKNKDDYISYIYVHNDGYPQHTLKMLNANYKSRKLAENLIELGNISFLDKSIEKPTGHTYGTPIKGYSIFYHRDRGESLSNNKAKKVFDIKLLEHKSDYTYIFNDKSKK